MSNLATKSFNRFDIFGSEVGLIYKSDNMYRTAFGGLVTITFVVLMVLLFFHNFATLVQKSKHSHHLIILTLAITSLFLNIKGEVNFVSSTSYDINPGILEINQDNFMIAVKIDQVNFINRPNYMISFERRHYYTLANGTYVQQKVPMFLEPCTIDHFSSLPNVNVNWTEQFQLQKVSDFLCLQKNQTFTIGGRFQSPDFFHLKFTVTQCSNKTTPTNPWKYQCASQETINQQQLNEDNRISFLYSNYLVKPEQPTDTLQVFLEGLIFTIQPNKMYTTANIFLNEQTLQTDNSILPITDINEEQFIVHKNGDYIQQYSVGAFTKFCEIFFLRSPFSTNTSRGFQKVDEVISYIGGFSQIFLLISTIVVSFYNEYLYYLELANKLYDFELKSPLKHAPALPKQEQQEPQITTNRHNNQSIYQMQTDRILSSVQLQQKNQSNNHEKDITRSDSSKKQCDGNLNANPIQQTRRKSKKVSQREDIGLIPLDDIKRIISTRKKTYINEKKNLIKKRFSKLNDIPQFTSPIQENKDEELNDQTNQDNNNQIIKEQIQNQNYNLDNRDYQFQNRQKFETIQSFNQIKMDVSPKEYAQSPLNSTRFKQTPLITNQQNKFTAQSDTNIPSLKKIMSRQKNLLSLGTNDSPDAQNCKEGDSNNSILNGYQNKIFEGLGFTDAQTFLEKELEFIIKRDRTIKLTYHYFINMLTCGKFCNTEEVRLLGKANKLVRRDLDIFNVLDKIKEVEKLKNLLLTEEEQVLFNFFPKPVIKVEEDNQLPSRLKMQTTDRSIKKESSKIKLNSSSKQLNLNLKNINVISRVMNRFKKNLKKNRITEYQTLFDCYDKITMQQDSKYKQKLVDLLGEEMKNIFEVAKLMTFKKNELNTETGMQSFRQQTLTMKKQNSNQSEMPRYMKAASSESPVDMNKLNNQYKISHFKQESANQIEVIPSQIRIEDFHLDDQDNITYRQKISQREEESSSTDNSYDQQVFEDRENVENTETKNQALERNIQMIKNPLNHEDQFKI